MEERECRRCSGVFPLSDFATHTRKTSLGPRMYRDWTCRKCKYAITNAYRDAHREHLLAKARVRRVQRKYGDEGVALKARAEAGEPCDICGSRTALMAIDHCHASGALRGLLCGNCNTALGLVRDNPLILARMISYLAGSLESRGVLT